MKPSRTVPLSYVLPDWLRHPVLPIMVATEIRAIFPAWSLAMLVIAIAPLLQDEFGPTSVMLGYGFGCIAIGAIAAGRDFMHRTVGTILSLPCPRERLWRTRLLVSLIGMILLAALAGVEAFLMNHLRGRVPSLIQVAIFLSPVFSGLLVAPWLTLVCRSALAGAVFTISLPFLFLPLAEATSESEGFKSALVGFLFIGHWIAGGFFGRRKFMHLEDSEGRTAELRLPGFLLGRSPAKSVSLTPKPGHPVWQLLKKELRLQRIAFVATTLYLLACFGVWTTHQLRPELDSAFIDIPTLLFIGLLSMLIGSEASAEERQLGTVEWQMLLPMAARKQWAVKVGTMLGLSVLLGALLPACVLQLVSWGSEGKEVLPGFAVPVAAIAMGLATMSLYFSSLCKSGLKALLISLPSAAGLLALAGFVRHRYGDLENALHSRREYFGQGPWEWLMAWLPLLLLAGLFLLTLRFALANHRSAERSAGRIWRQLGCLVAYVALSTALCYNVILRYAANDYPIQDPQEEAQVLSPSPATLASSPPGMNIEMMKRYGLIPPNATVPAMANSPAPRK